MRYVTLHITVFLLTQVLLKSQVGTNEKIKVYLIPGQGADYRLFNQLKLGDKYDTVHIQFTTPPRKCSLSDYAQILLEQVDSSENFILIGVSIGGMIAVEMSEIIKPLQTIVISSAKCRQELPHRYRFMRFFPLNKLTPKSFYKIGAQIAQPIVEPDRKIGKEVFKAMLKDKKPLFFKRTANMIINWKRKTYSDGIIHIHGNNDHTIPLRKVKADYIIKKGSHMMVYTKGEEINELLSKLLSPNPITNQ